MKNKKGQVMQNLGALGVGIATLVIVLVVAFLIMGNTKTQLTNLQGEQTDTNGSVAWNSTRDLQNATQTIPGWVPLVVLVAIGGLILSMIKVFGR